MTLNDEMQRLSKDFLGAYDDRMAAVAGIRAATAQDLSEYHSAHQEMGEEQRQRLAENRDHLASDTTALQAEFHSAHQEMGEEQRQRLAENRDRLASDTGAFMKETHAAHSVMAAELRQRLAEDSDRLASDVAKMRDGLQAEQSGPGRCGAALPRSCSSAGPGSQRSDRAAPHQRARRSWPRHRP